MRAARLGAGLALVAGLAASAQVLAQDRPRAQRGYDTLRASKAALPGQETRVWWAQMIDPDCTPHGAMTTAVVEPPRHGVVRLSDDAFFPSFPPDNPRAVCDRTKVAGKQAFYTAQAGYRGGDRLVLQNSTSEGRIRKIVVDIDVR